MILLSPNHCPECGYGLHGLPPPPYRCPECGFAYDEGTAIWRPPKPWMVYVTLGVVALYTGWRALNDIVDPLRIGVPPNAPRVGLIAVTSACLLAMVYWLRAAERRYAAVGWRGLTVRTRHTTASLPWDAVAGLAGSWQRCRIRVKGRRSSLWLEHFFATRAEADVFRAAVIARRPPDRRAILSMVKAIAGVESGNKRLVGAAHRA
jgi:hypothetical protein